MAEANYKGLGQIVWEFTAARWNIVSLGNTLVKSFISKQSGAGFAETAENFDLLAGVKPEWQELSNSFTDASSKFTALIAGIPYSAEDDEQKVGTSGANKYDWTDEEIDGLYSDLVKIGSQAGELLSQASK